LDAHLGGGSVATGQFGDSDEPEGSDPELELLGGNISVGFEVPINGTPNLRPLRDILL
jgi:hypothetical protein